MNNESEDQESQALSSGLPISVSSPERQLCYDAFLFHVEIYSHVIPSDLASAIWSWIILVSGQITQAFLLFCSLRGTYVWNTKLFPYPVESTASTSRFISRFLTAISCSFFSSKFTPETDWNLSKTSDIHAAPMLCCRYENMWSDELRRDPVGVFVGV